MKSTNTYLMFDGKCREAMEFYKKCLGGDLRVITYGEMPPQPGGSEGCEIPADAKNRVMHAELRTGPMHLMASDTMPGMPGTFTAGNNFMINLNCDDEAEVDRLFNALVQGGKTNMPVGETFWAKRFGMLTDKFGVEWMLNLEKPMSGDFSNQQQKREPVNA